MAKLNATQVREAAAKAAAEQGGFTTQLASNTAGKEPETLQDFVSQEADKRGLIPKLENCKRWHKRNPDRGFQMLVDLMIAELG